MILAIHQPQYMPWIGYFHKMESADLFVLLDDVQFKKNEWQHRNRIRNPNGTQWLSVPNHYKFPQKINEVEVRNTENWQRKHLQSIKMCYGKAVCFEEYIQDLEAFFGKTWTTIDQINHDSIVLLAKWMGVSTPVEVSSKCNFPGESTERLIHICRHFEADTYLAGAGGQNYMDVSLFEKAGIKVVFQEFQCPVYKQHWAKKDEDFIPNLSALDLVFNCGGESLELIMKQSR